MHEVTGVTTGTALELGSGEGADALWLANRCWIVTAIDISATALAVGAAKSAEDGLADHNAFPPGSRHSEHGPDAPALPTPGEVLASLELPAGWVVETSGLFERTVTGRDGTSLTLADAVVRLRREF